MCEPRTLVICDECERPWSEHQKTALLRAVDDYYEAKDRGYEPTGIVPNRGVVDYRDCILALKTANRGPQGYTGPMGVQGSPGCAHTS